MSLKVPVFKMDGTSAGELELDDKIFGVKASPALIQQAVVAQQANSRVAIAHTKTRGEVRGGGKKPWRQKGTGRARHGSIRSPIWKGGGVTFGPRSERNFSLHMNAKAKQRALFMTLSDKAHNGKLIVLESLELPKIQTKAIAGMLKSLKLNKTVLAVLLKQDPTLWKSARNLPKVNTAPVNSLNVVDILQHDALLMPKAAVEMIGKIYKR